MNIMLMNKLCKMLDTELTVCNNLTKIHNHYSTLFIFSEFRGQFGNGLFILPVIVLKVVYTLSLNGLLQHLRLAAAEFLSHLHQPISRQRKTKNRQEKNEVESGSLF